MRTKIVELIVRYEDGSENYLSGLPAQGLADLALTCNIDLWRSRHHGKHAFDCPECLHRVQPDEHGSCPHNRKEALT